MVNSCTFIGRTGKDPEIRHTDSIVVANFSLAMSEKYKDKETTTWINCVAFGKLAEIIEKYVKKGDLIYINGKLQNRTWEDKEGNKKYATEIIVNTMTMLGGKKSEGTASEEPAKVNAPAEEEKDLPF